MWLPTLVPQEIFLRIGTISTRRSIIRRYRRCKTERADLTPCTTMGAAVHFRPPASQPPTTGLTWCSAIRDLDAVLERCWAKKCCGEIALGLLSSTEWCEQESDFLCESTIAISSSAQTQNRHARGFHGKEALAKQYRYITDACTGTMRRPIASACFSRSTGRRWNTIALPVSGEPERNCPTL